MGVVGDSLEMLEPEHDVQIEFKEDVEREEEAETGESPAFVAALVMMEMGR